MASTGGSLHPGDGARPSYGGVPMPQPQRAQGHRHGQKEPGPPLIVFLERYASFLCEFVGTFVLAVTVGYCVLAGDPTWSPLAIACALMVSIYAVADVSGGHLNPAVTFTLALNRKIGVAKAISYVVVQYLGAFAAAGVLRALFGRGVEVVKPVPPFRYGQVAAVEIVYTATLCFVVASCAASSRNNPRHDRNQFFALAIGFVLLAGGYAVSGISGAVFNPALAAAFDLTSPADGVWGLLPYTFYELIGAAVAALCFYLCRPEDYDPQERLGEVSQPIGRDMWLRCLGEFLGTFLLSFTVCCCVITASVGTPLAASAALLCAVYSLWDVSGGHFNPAVTLAVACSGRGKCRTVDAAAYIVTQMLAGLVAGVLASYIHQGGPRAATTFGVKPQGASSWGAALAVELLFTCLLAHVVLAVGTTTPTRSSLARSHFPFGLAIGFSLAVGGVAAASVSGGVLNPAVAFSLATEGSMTLSPRGATAVATTSAVPTTVAANDSAAGGATVADRWEASFINFVYYSLMELVGGMCAFGIFQFTHAHEYYRKAPGTFSP